MSLYAYMSHIAVSCLVDILSDILASVFRKLLSLMEVNSISTYLYKNIYLLIELINFGMKVPVAAIKLQNSWSVVRASPPFIESLSEHIQRGFENGITL